MDRQTVNTVILAAAMAAGDLPVQPEPAWGPGVPDRMAQQARNAFHNLHVKGTLPPHPGLLFATIRAAQNAILDYFRPEIGYAWPSLLTAAEKSGLSLSTFRRARQWLIDTGFLLAFPQWRREDRTPPDETRPATSFRSTHYLPQVLPIAMLSTLSDEAYGALISFDGQTAEKRRAGRRGAAGPARATQPADGEDETVADGDEVAVPDGPSAHSGTSGPRDTLPPLASGTLARTRKTTNLSQSVEKGAPTPPPRLAHSPSSPSAPVALASAASSLCAPAPEARASAPRPTTEEEIEARSLFERLEQLTTIRLMPDRVLALGHHYKLTTRATLQVADDVLDWVTSKHFLNPTRAWKEDEVTDQFRVFARAAARGRRPLPSAPSVTDGERAQRNREAKLREQEYAKHKEAVQEREVEIGKVLFTPGFLAAKSFGVSAFRSPSMALNRGAILPFAPASQGTYAQTTARKNQELVASISGVRRSPP